jgi:hypothetical protein
MLKLLPKEFFEADQACLRILAESEWRGIGIMQSPGWEHYEVHGKPTLSEIALCAQPVVRSSLVVVARIVNFN